MDTSTGGTNGSEQESSFGIKKIVDVKIEDGRQMFKVKWEPTWEPAENLAGCQHLIDKFWSFVNKVKVNEEVAQQHRKRMRLDTSNITGIDQTFDRLSQDNKADVHRLIARTNATSVGNQTLVSPSNMLMTQQCSQQNNLMGVSHTPNKQNHNQNSSNFVSQQHQQNINSLSQKGSLGMSGNKSHAMPTKVEGDDSLDMKSSSSNSKSSLNNASLKYLENFNNPYVKIVIVCKICNKEQPSKFAGNWRQHYMTHSDKKPHKCPHCPKTFIRADQMRKHAQTKHGDTSSNMMAMKQEPMMSVHNVKSENFTY